MADADIYVSRIEKLETANRKARWWLICSSFIFAVLIALMAHQTFKSKVEATEFVLTDQSGQVVARLGTGKGGTCLEITGKAKAAGAIICAEDHSGASLVLTTNHGESKAFLSAGGRMYETVDQVLSPGLVLADGKNLFSATVGAAPTFLVKPSAYGNSVIVTVPPSNPRITIATVGEKRTWSAP